jgi:PucR-like helix-turn-helix protein
VIMQVEHRHADAAAHISAQFQSLMARRAGFNTLVRAAAGLAQCPAGLFVPGAPSTRVDADGRKLSDTVPLRISTAKSINLGGWVWLERIGGHESLDEFLVDRLAVAATAIRPRDSAASTLPGRTDVVLAQLVAGALPPAERVNAPRLLGFSPDAEVRIVAVGRLTHARNDPLVGVLAALAGGHAWTWVTDQIAAALTTSANAPAMLGTLRRHLHPQQADGPVVGVGTAVRGADLHVSWRQALIAMRFADPSGVGPSLVDYQSLGALALLADIPGDRLAELSDVRALGAIAETADGHSQIATLAAVSLHCSLRAAAKVLYLHHSSIAARLAACEAALGFELCAENWFRLRLALAAYRLSKQRSWSCDRSPVNS